MASTRERNTAVNRMPENTGAIDASASNENQFTTTCTVGYNCFLFSHRTIACKLISNLQKALGEWFFLIRPRFTIDVLSVIQLFSSVVVDLKSEIASWESLNWLWHSLNFHFLQRVRQTFCAPGPIVSSRNRNFMHEHRHINILNHQTIRINTFHTLTSSTNQ